MPKVLEDNRTPAAKSADRRHAMAKAMNNRGSCGRELIIPYGNQQVLQTSSERRDSVALALQNRYVPEDCHCIEGAGSASGPVTEFEDDFNRGDTAFGLGPNWLSSISLPPAGFSFVARIVSNMMRSYRLPAAAGGSANDGSWYLPIPPMSGLYGRSQFAQMTIASRTAGTFVQGGPMVMATPDIHDAFRNGYCLAFQAPGDAIQLMRGTPGTPSLAGPFGAAAGDVLRIEVAVGVASNIVTCFQNGIQIMQVTDSNVARPVAVGVPCFFLRYCDAAPDSMDWDDFSCGLVA